MFLYIYYNKVWGGGCGSVVEHLLSMHKALGSGPSTSPALSYFEPRNFFENYFDNKSELQMGFYALIFNMKNILKTNTVML